MRIAKHVGVAIVLLMWSVMGFSQQLRLGKNPYALQKSAILELESDNQGLLFPRITDTSLINTLTPPDGMVIYHQPSAQLMLHSGGHWKPLTSSDLLSHYWSTNGNSNGAVKPLGNIDNIDLSFITNNTERMRILASGNVGIGSNSFNATNPEKLLVDAGTTTSYNLMTGKGSINNYLQLNIQNQSSGNTASSDVVATANNGNESVNYIDMGINSSGFSNTTYPVISGANNAYLYSTGNDFVIGNATASKSLRFFTGGYANTNERLHIDGSGNVGIGTTSPSSILHVKTGVTDQSGIRMENLTSSSATTSGAATLGVDASGNVVRAKVPVYYSGGIGGSATVDGITKVWVADVANTASGIQTITIPTNIGFTSIVGITLTTKGGTGVTDAPVAIVTSNTTTQIVIRLLESKTTTIVLGGTVEGLEAHTNTSTRIYIRVEGN